MKDLKNSEEKTAEREVPLRLFTSAKQTKPPSVDMTQVVGAFDILILVLA